MARRTGVRIGAACVLDFTNLFAVDRPCRGPYGEGSWEIFPHVANAGNAEPESSQSVGGSE